MEKKELLNKILLSIITLVTIIIVVKTIKEREYQLEIEEEKIKLVRQQSLFEEYKQKVGEYPPTNSHKEVAYRVKEEIGKWDQEFNNRNWAKEYKASEDKQSYSIISKNKNIEITCTNQQPECHTKR